MMTGAKKHIVPANKGKKIKYFIVQKIATSDARPEQTPYGTPIIVRGYSAETVERRYIDSDFKGTIRNDYGGAYAPVFDYIIIGNKEGYANKVDVENAVRELCKQEG